MKDRLYLLWLHFLRYGAMIDLYTAKQAEHINEIAFSRLRIADLDRQIDNLEMASRLVKEDVYRLKLTRRVGRIERT